jgi:DNA-binding MarR family transcriptional regulator
VADIYDEQTYEPHKGVGYLLHRVRTEMLAAIDRDLSREEFLRELDVSSAQFIILAGLGKTGGSASVAELCKGMSYDAGAMTRMIDRLEDKALLRRQRDTSDRRLVRVELTEQGTAALPHMRRVSMRVANRFLSGFSAAEARQLEGLLGRMLENATLESARGSEA